MRANSFIIVVLAIGVLPLNLSAQPAPKYILDLHTVGSIKIGMTRENIYEIYGKNRIKQVDLQLEGMPSPAVELFADDKKAGEPEITFELDRGVIYRMQVRSPLYKTSKGIGVGSSFDDLLNMYGNSNFSISWGEEGFYGVIVESVQMSFGLDVNKTMNDSAIEAYAIKGDRGLIPAQTPIKTILVY